MRIFKNKILISSLFVLFVVITPSFIFSIYQYSSITDEEKVINDVYKNQLESILFSINQYSVDIINGWVNNIDEYILSQTDLSNLNLEEFLDQNDIISQLNINDVENNGEWLICSKIDNPALNTFQIEDAISNNSKQISELDNYIKNDYQKVIGVKAIDSSELVFLFFRSKSEKAQLGVITIKAEQFILENLSPRAQQVAEGKMNILVYNNKNKEIIFSNSLVSDLEDIQKSNELWLFPDYSIGVELTGNTLNDLVKQRVRTVIFLVLLFNILILFGIGFLYYNVKKELDLAKIKNDFVSNVSHELRTPLAMISMYSETLMMDRVKDDEKKKEYYEIIQLETNRLNGIVNNILSFSHIENNKRKYNFEDYYLNDLANEVIHVYKHELLNKGFHYELKLKQDLKAIHIDKDAIKDAIINLLSNSIKYSSERKQIDIISGEDSNSQFIEIRDQGIGISEKDQKQIFEKFFRVSDGNLAYKARGSGLGLSIVKHIMDAHNGNITVKSKLNTGSSFRLVFPIIK